MKGPFPKQAIDKIVTVSCVRNEMVHRSDQKAWFMPFVKHEIVPSVG